MKGTQRLFGNMTEKDVADRYLHEWRSRGGRKCTPAQQAARRENMRKLNERRRQEKSGKVGRA